MILEYANSWTGSWPRCAELYTTRIALTSACSMPRSRRRQELPHRPERASSMADAVLLLGRELRHRDVPPGRNEDRVVAEAAGPARLRRQHPLADGLRGELLAARERERDHTPVASRAPARRDALQRREQRGEVALLARILPRIARGARPGSSTERVHLDAGVVRDRGAVGERGDGARLQRGVLLIARSGLLDVRPVIGPIMDRDPSHGPIRADLRDLPELALVPRRDRDGIRERDHVRRYIATC